MKPYLEIHNGTVRLIRPFPAKMSLNARIQAAIDKWSMIEAFHRMAPSGTHLDGVDYSTCALCHKFQFQPECHGCPVAAQVKQEGCWGTPFFDYQYKPSARTAAKEVEFLRTVLEKQL